MNLQNSIRSIVSAAIVIAGGLAITYEGTRFVAYQDPVGVWTICEGHTKDVKKGDTATAAQCAQYLQQDLLEADAIVERCITHPLTDAQRGAMDDAVFNLGPKVVCGSTLQRKANAGDMQGACAELSRWVYAGGVKLKGLENRRAAELALCWPGTTSTIH